MAQVVTRVKRLRARAIVREFPRITRRLWGGELWDEGYVARPVGDKVTAAGIRRDLRQHRIEKTGAAQWSLFEEPVSCKAPPLAAGIFYFWEIGVQPGTHLFWADVASELMAEGVRHRRGRRQPLLGTGDRRCGQGEDELA
jgi:hypothetical protein